MPDLKISADELNSSLKMRLDAIALKRMSLKPVEECYIEFIKRAIILLKGADQQEISMEDLKLFAEMRKIANDYLEKLDLLISKDPNI